MPPQLHLLPNSDDLPNEDEEFVAQLTQHQTAILGFLVSLVSNHTDADDLLQKTNLVLWRKRQDFIPGTSFRSWAFSVARWEARAHFRTVAQKNWLLYDDDIANLVAEHMSSTPAAENTQQIEALRNCLGKLSRKNKKLIINRYVLGFSNRECADKMNRSEAGLRVTLFRLRATLRKCVSKVTGGGQS